MLWGMPMDEAETLMSKVTAAAIVNQAVIKCTLSDLPVTHDNIILMIGDFFDPRNASSAPIVEQVVRQIHEVLETAKLVKEGLLQPH